MLRLRTKIIRLLLTRKFGNILFENGNVKSSKIPSSEDMAKLKIKTIGKHHFEPNKIKRE